MFFSSRAVLCLCFSLAAVSFPTVPTQSQANVAPHPAQKFTAPKPLEKQALALFDAAEKGDTTKVKALLNRGVSARVQAPNGLTPLIIASMMNHPDTVKLLLDRGADVDAAFAPGARISGSTALIMATSTFVCIMAGAKLPASPKGYEGHEIEFMKQHPDQVRQWEEQMAVWGKGYGLIVRMLVDHGADVNAQAKTGMTAVGNAAESGELDAVRLLLDKGARLDLPTHEIDLLNGKPLDATNGYMALAGATSAGQHNPEIIKLLLAHGAKPNAKSTNDLTPLGRAAESGDAEVVQMLLDAGASVNAYDPFGRTALMLAQGNKHAEVAALLRKAGARDLPRGPHDEVTMQEVKPREVRPRAGQTQRDPRGIHVGPPSDRAYTITRHVDKPKDAPK